MSDSENNSEYNDLKKSVSDINDKIDAITKMGSPKSVPEQDSQDKYKEDQKHYDSARERQEERRKMSEYKEQMDQLLNQNKELMDQLNKMKQSNYAEKLKSESMKIASSMADGSNAELLSEFVSKRMQYGDDGLKILDSNGNPSSMSVNELMEDMKKSGKYSSLLRQSKAEGTDMKSKDPGAPKGSDNSMSMSRQEFNKLSAQRKMELSKKGVDLTD